MVKVIAGNGNICPTNINSNLLTFVSVCVIELNTEIVEKNLQIEPAVVNTLDGDRCSLSINEKVIDISSLTSRHNLWRSCIFKIQGTKCSTVFHKQAWSK